MITETGNSGWIKKYTKYGLLPVIGLFVIAIYSNLTTVTRDSKLYLLHGNVSTAPLQSSNPNVRTDNEGTTFQFGAPRVVENTQHTPAYQEQVTIQSQVSPDQSHFAAVKSGSTSHRSNVISYQRNSDLLKSRISSHKSYSTLHKSQYASKLLRSATYHSSQQGLQSSHILQPTAHQSQQQQSAYQQVSHVKQQVLHQQILNKSHPPVIQDDEFAELTKDRDRALSSFRYRFRPNLSDNRTSCTERHFSRSLLPITALASYPGSGNTWTRHLIELITGLYTGAVFDDTALHASFPAEGIVSERVVAVKTHCPWYGSCILRKKRAVLIVRHPQEAIKSAKTYLATEDHNTILEYINPTDWKEFYQTELRRWSELHQFWLAKALAKQIDLFILFYKDLQSDLGRALINLSYFLGMNSLNIIQLNCVLQHNEGNHHRVSSHVFDDLEFFEDQTNVSVDAINGLIHECIQKQACATSGKTSVVL